MTKRAAAVALSSSTDAFGIEIGESLLGSRSALAEFIGVHRSQISRGAKGQRLGDDAGWRLASLEATYVALAKIYDPAVIPDWLLGLNPHLNDRRPLDVLAEGDLGAVMQAIQAARTGAFA